MDKNTNTTTTTTTTNTLFENRFYVVSKATEDETSVTYTVKVAKNVTAKGGGMVTRSTLGGFIATYDKAVINDDFEIVRLSGLSAEVKGETIEQAQAELDKAFPSAKIKVTSVDAIPAEIRGLPVPVFTLLGVQIERPESQQKKG